MELARSGYLLKKGFGDSLLDGSIVIADAIQALHAIVKSKSSGINSELSESARQVLIQYVEQAYSQRLMSRVPTALCAARVQALYLVGLLAICEPKKPDPPFVHPDLRACYRSRQSDLNRIIVPIQTVM